LIFFRKKKMRERPCPISGCRTWIGEELMCARHYRRLPVSILASIERARRVTRSRESAAYVAACRTAIDYVNRANRSRRRRVRAIRRKHELSRQAK
jgi:hypothetical protein